MAVTLGWVEYELSSFPPHYKIAFSNPHSYRGYYEHVAFEPIVVSVKRALFDVNGAIGATYTGYKGGEFYMTSESRVYYAEQGSCLSGKEDQVTGFEVDHDAERVWVLYGSKTRSDFTCSDFDNISPEEIYSNNLDALEESDKSNHESEKSEAKSNNQLNSEKKQ